MVIRKICFDLSTIEETDLKTITYSNRGKLTTVNTGKANVVETLDHCPDISPFLAGQLEFVDINATALNLNLSKYYGGEIELGGIWKPKYCNARKKVAFMIPFRNRWEQLTTFLNHMHPIFQKQQLDYRIFVIEQVNCLILVLYFEI